MMLKFIKTKVLFTSITKQNNCHSTKEKGLQNKTLSQNVRRNFAPMRCPRIQYQCSTLSSPERSPRHPQPPRDWQSLRHIQRQPETIVRLESLSK